MNGIINFMQDVLYDSATKVKNDFPEEEKLDSKKFVFFSAKLREITILYAAPILNLDDTHALEASLKSERVRQLSRVNIYFKNKK